MPFQKYPNNGQLSLIVSDLIVKRIENSDSCLIGLSTGFSPQLTYSLIAKKLAKKPSLVPKIRGFQLDEWLGLSKKDSSSCSHYISENIIKPWNINPEQCSLTDGQSSNQETQIAEMKERLNQNPL